MPSAVFPRRKQLTKRTCVRIMMLKDLPERFSGKNKNPQTGGNAADPFHTDSGQAREAELPDPRAFVGFFVSGHRRKRNRDLWQEEQAQSSRGAEISCKSKMMADG